MKGTANNQSIAFSDMSHHGGDNFLVITVSVVVIVRLIGWVATAKLCHNQIELAYKHELTNSFYTLQAIILVIVMMAIPPALIY